MGAKGRVLVVEDDVDLRKALSDLLSDEGFAVVSATDGFRALAKIDSVAPDVLLVDLRMPGMDGMELMRRVHVADPRRAVIIMTANAAVDSAVSAMHQGATHYLKKPLDVPELVRTLEDIVQRQRLRAAADAAPSISGPLTDTVLVGQSPQLQSVLNTARQVAPTRASVLISGETGTGKEMLALTVHQASRRARGPFVKLHCSALSESLLESELFGHERGAFTGALTRRDGRFMQANGGTLFLDEIGEVSQNIQVKLLRFLQEREFERVGGNETIKVDVRVIAATNRNLLDEVRAGRFREDLYYRLNVVSLAMPPLRARQDDIPLLAAHFLHSFAAENEKDVRGIDDDALAALVKHSWPGNVRELENVIARGVVVTTADVIRLVDLPASLGELPNDAMPTIPGASLDAVERFLILKTLEFTGGRREQAAQILGISHRKIQYKLQEYADTNAANNAPAADDDDTAGR